MNVDILFQIKFVTPTFNFGENKKPNSTGLRATSLRGLWRFWARAIIAGTLSSPNPKSLRILENGLFGSTDPSFMTFRLRTKTVGQLSTNQYLLVPHKQSPCRTGWEPGKSIDTQITLNHGLPRFKKRLEESRNRKEQEQAERIPVWDDYSKKALLAIIWLWGNLGGVGLRARRGFGSVVLLTKADESDPFVTAGLPKCCDTFKDIESLSNHLKKGILQSFILVKNWIDEWEKRGSSQYKTNNHPESKRVECDDMYTLSSLDQVFVSNKAIPQLGAEISNPSGLLKTISEKLKITDETGSGNPRLASPMIVRIHHIKNEKSKESYCPVLTWSPRSSLTIDKSNGNGPWLQKLEFDKSLKGDSLYA